MKLKIQLFTIFQKRTRKTGCTELWVRNIKNRCRLFWIAMLWVKLSPRSSIVPRRYVRNWTLDSHTLNSAVLLSCVALFRPSVTLLCIHNYRYFLFDVPHDCIWCEVFKYLKILIVFSFVFLNTHSWRAFAFRVQIWLSFEGSVELLTLLYV